MTARVSPRIGIIGSGAIGGFYGMLLARAGFDVHFLLRSDFDEVAHNGLRLNSASAGAFHLQPVQAYRQASDMPTCDWLLVGAKALNNAALAPLINACAAEDCKVVVLQNGLAPEDELRPLLPDSVHLLGGLCFICAYRSAPGVIEHQALGAVNLGYHSGPAIDQAARRQVLDEGVGLFRQAGIDSTAVAELAQARWQKLVWNVPYNGLSVLLAADTRALMSQSDSRALIQALMDEVIAAAAASGHPLPEGLAGKMLAATERMPQYWPSMYHDYQQRRPMELQEIYAAPLAAATKAGLQMPRTEALYRALCFLQQRNLQDC